MQIVILAAGKGTRMLPLTKLSPKPMVPVLGKPKLQYSLDLLPDEVDEVIFVINYLGEQIKDFFGESYGGKKIKYVYQKDLNGTGGALFACQDVLRDEFLVIMGDDFYGKEDLRKLIKNDLSILLYEDAGSPRVDFVVLDKFGNFKEIASKEDFGNDNKSFFLNTGAYKLNKNFFNYHLVSISNNEFGLPQTMLRMISDFDIKAEFADLWLPFGTTGDVKILEKEIIKFLV